MSFEQFEFVFTPPPTVPDPVVKVPSTTPTGEETAAAAAEQAGSLAGDISTRLEDLALTAEYLQSIVLNRTSAMAVSFDVSVSPDVGLALNRIYGEQAPDSVTIPMFNRLLDADLGILQLELAAGLDAPFEANPVQAADLLTVTKAVESNLIDQATYRTALPLYLRSLKADAIVHRQLSHNLLSYPAASRSSGERATIPNALRPGVIAMANNDLSFQYWLYLDDMVNSFSSAYSGVYQMLAGINAVERDVVMVVNQYFYQPLEQIVRIISLFNAAKGFVHKVRFSDLQNDLINYAFVRLESEVGEMLISLDRMVRIAVQPLKGAMGTLGNLVNGVQSVAADIGYLRFGGLKGLASTNACAKPENRNRTGASQVSNPKTVNIPGLGAVSDGLRSMGEMIDWSQRETERQLKLVDEQFVKLTQRRLSSNLDRQELTCSLRALDTLMGIGNGFIRELQQGNTSPQASAQQKSVVVNRILSSLKTGTDTSFSVGNGEVLVVPPKTPEPSEPVKRVLAQGGVKSFRRPTQRVSLL